MIASRPYQPIALTPGGIGPVDPPMTTGTAMGSSGLPTLKGPNFGQRLDAVLKQPGMAAALLRSGAATLNGGLGDGIAAGAHYMDQFHAGQTADHQQALENLMKQHQIDIQQQSADQTGQYQDATVGTNVARLEEDARHNRSGETLTGRQQNITYNLGREGHQIQRQGQEVQRYGIDVNSGDRRYGIDTQSYDAREGRTNQRTIAAMGIGGRADVARTNAATKGMGSGKPPAAMQKAAEVLPANAQPGDLSVGHVYRTARGLGQWDGAQFIPVG